MSEMSSAASSGVSSSMSSSAVDSSSAMSSTSGLADEENNTSFWTIVIVGTCVLVVLLAAGAYLMYSNKSSNEGGGEGTSVDDDGGSPGGGSSYVNTTTSSKMADEPTSSNNNSSDSSSSSPMVTIPDTDISKPFTRSALLPSGTWCIYSRSSTARIKDTEEGLDCKIIIDIESWNNEKSLEDFILLRTGLNTAGAKLLLAGHAQNPLTNIITSLPAKVQSKPELDGGVFYISVQAAMTESDIPKSFYNLAKALLDANKLVAFLVDFDQDRLTRISLSTLVNMNAGPILIRSIDIATKKSEWQCGTEKQSNATNGAIFYSGIFVNIEKDKKMLQHSIFYRNAEVKANALKQDLKSVGRFLGRFMVAPGSKYCDKRDIHLGTSDCDSIKDVESNVYGVEGGVVLLNLRYLLFMDLQFDNGNNDYCFNAFMEEVDFHEL